MNDTERYLLEDHLDGRLHANSEAEVAALLVRDREARRFVRDHRAVWDALGEVYGELDEPSEVFTRSTVNRALSERPRRRIPLGLAAALLIALGLATWWRMARPPAPLIDPADEEIVRHLHMLRDLELLETHAEALDLRLRWDVLAAFEGEQEGEG